MTLFKAKSFEFVLFILSAESSAYPDHILLVHTASEIQAGWW